MKKTATMLLKAAVSIGILVYIFTKVVDIRSLWANLREANLSFLVAAIAVYFIVQTLSAYRWYLLLKPQGIEISFRKILSLYLLGMYFNFFLPSAIGGDVFRVYYLHKYTGKLSASTASVFLDRDLGMGGLMLVATLVSALAWTNVEGVPLAPIFGLIGIVFIAANLAIFYRPTYNLLHRLLSLFKMKKADEKVERLFESVNSYRGRWDLIAYTILLSIGVQVGCALVNVLTANSIGLSTAHGWIDYLVFIPAIGLLGMIPLSVNGAGWREFSYIILFESVGATKEQAGALSVLWLVVMIATSLPGGIIYLRQGQKARPQIEDEEIEENGGDAAIENVGKHIQSLSSKACEEEPVSTI
ncbi:MAG TPA: lysylphosphatidylglycerol synthase transmembrane domain-containing protein [Blastocatellia bacterium]|nr:lysylphosphatidylglycerol synthase transmembrane domain-containing protein [Blastocatellia bacterium]